MDLHAIAAELCHEDLYRRIKAIRALEGQPPSVAFPLLRDRVQDDEFLVRTFVARSLGAIRNDESFAALLQMAQLDDNPNVRGEAANSLSLFGDVATPHLLTLFMRDRHWLVRRSILGAFADDVERSQSELLAICREGVKGDDLSLREASTGALAALVDTDLAEQALRLLLELAASGDEVVQIRAAYALRQFDDDRARAALLALHNDEKHRVVAAVMEGWLPQDLQEES